MQLVDPAADDAAGRPELALDQEPHRQRRGVPAARRQAAKHRGPGGFVVEVKGLRVELGSKALDPLGLDPPAP